MAQDRDDPYDLQRFVNAQAPVYRQVLAELRDGTKRGHWMWFIFPQVAGLGHSPTARRFAISGRGEALAYLDHPLLGPRLRECTRAVTAVEGRTVGQIFGHPDDLKFHSSMTLFATVAPADDAFRQALGTYFDGKPDRLTLERL
jgi:uncharacterized protein (DUF1810 family)